MAFIEQNTKVDTAQTLALLQAQKNTNSKATDKKTNTPAFADQLSFSSSNLNNSLAMSSTKKSQDVVRDQPKDKSYDKPHDDKPYVAKRDKKVADSRDDDKVREHPKDESYAKDKDTSTDRSDNDRQDASDTSKDQRSDDKDTPQKESKSSDDTNDKDTVETSDNTDADTSKADEVANEAASNDLGQAAAAAAQSATDPAIIAAAAAQQNTNQGTVTQDAGEEVLNVQTTGDKTITPLATDEQTGKQQSQGTQQGLAQKQQQQAQNNLAQQGTALNTQDATQTQGQTQTQSNVQQQAADLSKKIGPNQKVDIQVEVTDGTQTTASQPSGSLSNAAAVAANAKGANNGVNNAPQNQNAQAAALNNEQAALVNAQTQNTQDQKMASMVSDTKNMQVAAGKASTTMAPTTGSETTQVNATTQTQTTSQAQQAANAKPAHQANAHVHTTARPEHISVEITKAIQAGADKITIQLKPADLGRIDVQLDLHAGKMTATITADRPETLDMLKNDAKELQKAMRDAGLDMGDMNFNLRQGQNQERQADNGNNFSGPTGSEDLTVMRGEDVQQTQQEELEMRAQLRAAYGGVDLSA
ncbi:MAG: flagellar hook-length control protein FliK [Methylocystaceae bacterium]|nr:flagellar hook-length control protein FliK [Methylocystaceae bacterium]